MTKKQKIWGIIILIIVGINIVLFSVLNQKAKNGEEEIPIFVAAAPLEESDQIYRMQFYARGSECGLYINDQLVYDTYGRSIGSITGDHLDNINGFLQNGENQIALKLLSRGAYFEPGDDYQCKAWIKAGKGKSISEVVAYLQADYAGTDTFTMGDSAEYAYVVPTNFVPNFTITSEDDEKVLTVFGILTLHNLSQDQNEDLK